MATVDLLLVSTDAVSDAADLLNDDAMHPVDEPIAIMPALELRVDRVAHDLGKMVMDECEPKGWSRGRRQWGTTWGFFRENPPLKSRNEPYAWDPDRAMYSAVALSRLIQPNVIGTNYAARVFNVETKEPQIHPGPVIGQSAYAFQHEEIRKRWLTRTDGAELAALFQAYWPTKDSLPGRIRRGLWNHEYAALTENFNIRLVIVATALEGLVHTDRYQSTRQFCRVSQLAGELGVAFSTVDAEDAYDLRSHVAHGNRLGDLTGKYAEVRMADLLLAMEHILRAALRRGIEDPGFAGLFADEATIRARWPI